MSRRPRRADAEAEQKPPSAEDVPNPIAAQGLLLSPREYDVVSKVIAAFADQAKTEQPEIHRVLVRVLGRMSHAQQAPGGLRDDQKKRYQAMINDAFAKQDERALTLAVENLIAATLRTDADPAQKVSRYLLELAAQLLAAQAMHGAATLKRLANMIDDAITAWIAEGWPPPRDAVAWIRDLIAVGKQNLDEGEDPWPPE